MKYQKCLLCFGLIVVSTVILYLLLTNEYLILKSIYTPVTSLVSISNPIEEIISGINLNYSQPLFQSHLSPCHPYLHIHLYTQNLSSLKDPSKLILLGNGFFGDENWGINMKAKSPIERSKTNLIY
jgi:hypothetical protein